MLNVSQNQTLDRDDFDPIRFGLKLTELFGPELSWASLRHPRPKVVYLELGRGQIHENFVGRRINLQGFKLVKPADGSRWQAWDGASTGSGPYNAAQVNEQFRLLETACQHAPLTAVKPKLFFGTPLEHVIG